MRFPGGIDRERWFKWIVSLKGPGVPEETTLQPFLSGIVLIGLTGVPSTSMRMLLFFGLQPWME